MNSPRTATVGRKMTHYLKNLFIAIAQTESELELQQTVISTIGEYFAAKRYRLVLLDLVIGRTGVN